MKLKTSIKAFFLLLIIISAFIYIKATLHSSVKEFDVDFSAVNTDLKPLFTAGNPYSDNINIYLDFYGLNFSDKLDIEYEHFFGTFQSNNYTLAAHVFKPQNYKATVFLLHGYFHHCGQLNDLILHLLNSGYAVAAYDMPGHGLSSGNRGEIESFSHYSEILLSFLQLVKTNIDAPYHLIGQSTGGTIAIDQAFAGTANPFDKIVLVAPLVHSQGYRSSKLLFRFLSPFVSSIPRNFTKNTSDEELIRFLEYSDPLQVRRVPLVWFNALIQWNRQFTQYPACEKEVLIIQGTIDTTVDWQFNLDVISKKLSNTKIRIIDDGGHILLNESPQLQAEVFKTITEYLDE